MLLRNGVNGGIMKRQNPEHKPVNYIAVESIDEYIKKIEELGGSSCSQNGGSYFRLVGFGSRRKSVRHPANNVGSLAIKSLFFFCNSTLKFIFQIHNA